MPESTVRGLADWLILGIVQGLTEIFPVSSSAHLALLRAFWASVAANPGPSFAGMVYLHLSMFFAVIVAYRGDVKNYVTVLWLAAKRLLRSEPLDGPEFATWRVIPGLVLATALTAVIAVPLEGTAESLFGHPVLVGILLIGNGVILCVTGSQAGEFRSLSDLGWRDYIWIGILQGLAVMPGISRFGIVLCTGLWRRLSWFEALKLAFLVSMPITLAVNVYQLLQTWLASAGTGSIAGDIQLDQLVLGIAVATGVSLLAIHWLRQGSMYAYRKLNYFGLYSIAVGVFSTMFFWLLG